MVLQRLLLALKGNPQVRYEKNFMILPVFLLFHNTGHNLAQILPQDHTQFDFFLLVSDELCQGIQLILKTLIGIQ